MIIVNLKGGLGNQMFQYAMARSIALKNNKLLVLDLSFYSNQKDVTTKRHFELNIFNLKCFIIKNRIIKNILKLFHSEIIERAFSFNKNISKLGNSNYIFYGYWQTEKYFKKYRRIILKDFSFPKKISEKNKKLINKIKNNQTVSLHVRRGDYVNDKKTNEFHGTCSKKYYEDAIKLINKKIKNPLFIIFSDDLKWCKNNLSVPKNTIFVDHNKGNQSFEDMRLMSLCKHNIIANSSFSWWGAWLNQNKNKIVIAPKWWFGEKSIDTSDVIPEKWIKI